MKQGSSRPRDAPRYRRSSRDPARRRRRVRAGGRGGLSRHLATSSVMPPRKTRRRRVEHDRAGRGLFRRTGPRQLAGSSTVAHRYASSCTRACARADDGAGGGYSVVKERRNAAHLGRGPDPNIILTHFRSASSEKSDFSHAVPPPKRARLAARMRGAGLLALLTVRGMEQAGPGKSGEAAARHVRPGLRSLRSERRGRRDS